VRRFTSSSKEIVLVYDDEWPFLWRFDETGRNFRLATLPAANQITAEGFDLSVLRRRLRLDTVKRENARS
jgi:hypothetical protein